MSWIYRLIALIIYYRSISRISAFCNFLNYVFELSLLNYFSGNWTNYIGTISVTSLPRVLIFSCSICFCVWVWSEEAGHLLVYKDKHWWIVGSPQLRQSESRYKWAHGGGGGVDLPRPAKPPWRPQRQSQTTLRIEKNTSVANLHSSEPHAEPLGPPCWSNRAHLCSGSGR